MSAATIASDPLVEQRGLTRAEWEALVSTGVLEGQHVELVEGLVVQVHPQGGRHMMLVTRLHRHLTLQLGEPWIVRTQGPLAASDRSMPEPDVAVVRDTGPVHPETAELVVEVAVTSQRMDLVHKPALYAAADVQQYWVVDLPAREIIVHTGPGADGYATVRRLPLDTPLSVLGVEVDLAALVDDAPAGSAKG